MQQLGERLGPFEREDLQDVRAQVLAAFFPLLGQRAHARANRGHEHAQVVGAAR